MRTFVEMPRPSPQSANMDFFKFWAAESVDDNLDRIIEHWRRQDRQIINRWNDTPAAEPPQVTPSAESAVAERNPQRPAPGHLVSAPRGPVPALQRPVPPKPPTAARPHGSKWLAKNPS